MEMLAAGSVTPKAKANKKARRTMMDRSRTPPVSAGRRAPDTGALKDPRGRAPRRPQPPACRPFVARRVASSSALLDSQSDLRSLSSSAGSLSSQGTGPGASSTTTNTSTTTTTASSGPATGGARQASARHKRQRQQQQANTRLTTTSQASTRRDQRHHEHNGDIFGVHRGDDGGGGGGGGGDRKDTPGQDNGSVPRSGGRDKKGEKPAKEADASSGSQLLKAYYLCASIGSVVAVIFMVIAFATPYWENIEYDKGKVVAAAERNPDFSVMFPADGAGAGADGYFTVTNVAALAATTTTTTTTAAPSGAPDGGSAAGTVTGTNTTTIPAILHIPMRKHGGLWSTCDTIPDDLRQQLIQQASGVLYPKCMSHLKYTTEELKNNVHLDMLLSLSRSSNACAIVAIITGITAMGLGAFAAIKQQIVFAVITGVCFGAAGLYTLFTVTLMLLRKAEVASDEHAIPSVALAGRVVTSGWAMYLGWMSFLLCTSCCVFWILLSVELRRARQNNVLSTNYDQICSM